MALSRSTHISEARFCEGKRETMQAIVYQNWSTFKREIIEEMVGG